MSGDFPKIEAWQRADDLCADVYVITRAFPPPETSGLIAQVRNASIAVPLRIAESSECGSKEERLRLLQDARCSLTRVRYLLHLSVRLEFINDESVAESYELCDKAGDALGELIESVE